MNTNRIIHGVYGGLLGGLVFGAMMWQMGMLPMIGKMVGHPSAGTGFIVHMINSAIIGAVFALTLGGVTQGLGKGISYGLLYGTAWWFIGPLTLMPLFLGMGFGVNWNFTAAVNMLPSLGGHLVYGAVLGVLYGVLERCQVVGREVGISKPQIAK